MAISIDTRMVIVEYQLGAYPPCEERPFLVSPLSWRTSHGQSNESNRGLLCSSDAHLLARAGISGPARHTSDDAKEEQGCLRLCLSKNKILPVHDRS